MRPVPARSAAELKAYAETRRRLTADLLYPDPV